MPVVRLDADAARTGGGVAPILDSFASVEGGAILTGTQMIAKGHDFPDVELAVVIDADTALAIPDQESAWLMPAVARGYAAARGQRPDVLYSSAPPWTGHLVARALSGLLGRAWVADFRDPWSRAPWREDRPPFVLRALARLERQVVARADAVLFVTPVLISPAFQSTLPHVVKFLPHEAALSLLRMPVDPATALDPVAALLLLAAWAAASVATARVVFVRADS